MHACVRDAVLYDARRKTRGFDGVFKITNEESR